MRGTDQIIYVLVCDPDPGDSPIAQWGEDPTTGPTGPVALKSIEDAEQFRAVIGGCGFTIEPTTVAELLDLAPAYNWRHLWTMGARPGTRDGTFYSMSLAGERPHTNSR